MLSFLKSLLTHCGAFKRRIQKYLYFPGIQFSGSCNDTKSKSLILMQRERSERVTVRQQWEKHLQGKSMEVQRTKWKTISVPSLIKTIALPLLHSLPYPMAAAKGTVRLLACVFAAQLPIHAWRTHINRSTEDKTEQLQPTSARQMWCGETTEGYRWGFWSPLAVT